MANSKPIDDILTDLDKVLRVMRANPTFKVGDDITLASVEALATNIRAKKAATEETRTLLTAQVNDANSTAADGWQVVVRVRGGVRASFGPDSNEYEQIGGTRSSERKKPKKKKA